MDQIKGPFVLNPEELFEFAEHVSTDLPAQVVLLHSFQGFVDAGHVGRLATDQLLNSLEHQVLGQFDFDQLYDYRARRPVMTFEKNHWAGFDRPSLTLYQVKDLAGRPFLLLAGLEPDLQWERFSQAVGQLAERLGAPLILGWNAVPMAVPHTRPIGVTAHSTRPELVAHYPTWLDRVQVPGHISAVLEWTCGQNGRDAVGFAVHVPHYLAQIDYPPAAAALLEEVAEFTGLSLPTAQLQQESEQVRGQIDEQVTSQSEIRQLVDTLEAEYDRTVADRGRTLLAAEQRQLPSADELAAEFEQFLAEQSDGSGLDG
jgi:predicted ATP-grasp superfamily ATP-dependent carboligase